jgi:hypothetical protein
MIAAPGHIARKQLPHVADREHVGIDHDRAPGVAHQLGRHEAQRGERLQIVEAPELGAAPAQRLLAVASSQEVVIPGMQDLHVQPVGVARVAPHRMLCDQRAELLLVVGMDVDGCRHDGHPPSVRVAVC